MEYGTKTAFLPLFTSEDAFHGYLCQFPCGGEALYFERVCQSGWRGGGLFAGHHLSSPQVRTCSLIEGSNECSAVRQCFGKTSKYDRPVDSQPEKGKERVDPVNKFVDIKKRVAERQAQYSKIAAMYHQQYKKYIHAIEDEYDGGGHSF